MFSSSKFVVSHLGSVAEVFWSKMFNWWLNCLLVSTPDSWLKDCEFESRQENFLFQSQLCMLTLIRCPFHPHVTAVARKRPRSFCQKCRWQVTPKHAYTLDPTKSEWADYAVVQALCGNLIRKRVHTQLNTRSQSSQLAELMWTIPGVKSGLYVHKLIST